MSSSILFCVLAVLTSQLGQAAPLEPRASPAMIPVGTSYNGWTSIGCYQDTYDTSRQILTKNQYQPSMTFASCSAFCGAGGYQYMGMSNGQWCYCDNQINLYSGLGYATTADKCNLGCAGESTLNCGAFWTNAMFQVSSKYNAAQASASSASSLAAYSSQAAQYSASSNAAAYSASSAAAYSAASASAYASNAAAYSAASLAAYSSNAGAYSSKAAQYSSSTSAAAAASASAYSASSAGAYSSSSSAAAYSASIAGAYSASSAAQYSSSSRVAAYSASSAGAYSASSSAAAYSASSASAYSSSASAYSASSSAAAAAATTTPAPWVPASVACVAEGTSGRALNGASTSAPDMTYSKCLTFCANQGFAIAGTEYGQECYCGNSLVNGASLSSPSSQCNMACGGSSTKTCGGPGALTLFVIPSKITGLSANLNVKTASLPTGWTAASTACVAEGTTGRALTGAATSSSDMTGAKCAAYCSNLGFVYAGTEYGQECYCGNSLVNGASLSTPSNACNMACGGDVNSICGGPGALTLYTNPTMTPSVTASSNAVSGAIPAGWSAASSVCIQEVNGRALTGAFTSGSSMTTATCLAFCQAKGFQYAGTEFGQECYCGNSLVNGASLSVTSQQCNMACANDATATCGGPNAIQLYVNPSLAPVVAAPTVINGFTSSGCIQEVAGRALTGLRVDAADMTLEKCASACANAGFTYAAAEYGQECYCGNSLVNGASTTLTSGQCNMPCPGNSAEMCGGPNALQLMIANK